MKILIVSVLIISIIIGCRMAFKKINSQDSTHARNSQHLNSMDLYPKALYPVEVDGKWGFMNNRLEIVIPAIYSTAEEFREGLAAVALEPAARNKDNRLRFGFVDTGGKLVADYKYHKVSEFQNGMAVVMKDNRYGFIDRSGKEIIPLQYEDAASFSEGLAVVKINGKNGFINQAGKMIIQPGFVRTSWVSAFAEGMAPVYFENDLGGYIDSTGRLVIPAVYNYVGPFSEGLALVQLKENYKYGFINKKGEMVIAAKYELSLPFHEGVATVKKLKADGNYVFEVIDKTGRAVSPEMKYSFVGIFKEGLAGVEKNQRWGFIDKQGKEVISTRYASVRLFNNGLSRIQTGALFTGLKNGYIDQAGNKVN